MERKPLLPQREAALYTRKQMGDACEMLVAAELTLAGIPALKVPDLWPGYDVIAQPLDREAQRISVKSRTFKRGPAYLEYNAPDIFDWLAVVLLPGIGEIERQIFLIPRQFADDNARRNGPATNQHTNDIGESMKFRGYSRITRVILH